MKQHETLIQSLRRRARHVRQYNDKGHRDYAFENVDIIDLDLFTGRRLLYWIGMQRNSIRIRKFVAEYFAWKFPDDGFWIPILKKRGLI